MISESTASGKSVLGQHAQRPYGDVPSCSLLTGLTALLILCSKLAMLYRDGWTRSGPYQGLRIGQMKMTRN